MALSSSVVDYYKFCIMLLLSNATTLIFVYYIGKSKLMREVFEKINFYNDIIIYGHWYYNMMKYIFQIMINFKYLMFLIDFLSDSISIPRYKLAFLFILFSYFSIYTLSLWSYFFFWLLDSDYFRYLIQLNFLIMNYISILSSISLFILSLFCNPYIGSNIIIKNDLWKDMSSL